MLGAQQWLESWTEISGVEGIVLKAMNQPCRLGHRGWYKLRKRNTTGVIIGVITGILIRPQLLLGGPVAVAQHPLDWTHGSAERRAGVPGRGQRDRGIKRWRLDGTMEEVPLFSGGPSAAAG
ncbi:hypothetical protein ABZY83_33590 [Streptomyces virginiae]|uniref:hypothetical protein n=1 Tax=Streptomyces virginiae TaxID=1961 RepID=UPI0033B562B3